MDQLALRNLGTLTVPQARALSYAQLAWQNRATLGQIGKSAWQGAKMVYGYGKRKRRKFYRVSRRYAKKRRMMRQIGERPGSSSSKKHALQDDATILTLSTRTLYSQTLTDLPKQTGDEINRRDRDIARLSGVKFCWELANNTSDPVYLNWAIVIPKGDNTVGSADFFRAYGTSRSVTFGSSLTSNDFHCRPINSDRYDIVTHKRYRLGPNNGASNTTWYAGTEKSYMNLNKYIKIKRQFRYEGVLNQSEGRIPILVYWFDQFLKPSGTTPVPVVNILQRNIQYFRDPK